MAGGDEASAFAAAIAHRSCGGSGDVLASASGVMLIRRGAPVLNVARRPFDARIVSGAAASSSVWRSRNHRWRDAPRIVEQAA